VQAAYYQLKLGKGFFKQFSKGIGKDDRRECFGNCNTSFFIANIIQRKEGY
jgi:hypothetical protein